ncbi:hypothetical protein [Pedobacter sp. MW01-1-1]|uniref:hypothetical protein n=1 Tax=Pedobacter sp. MW01-1-1 TaxID=3383027 RepID=UPI003FF05062
MKTNSMKTISFLLVVCSLFFQGCSKDSDMPEDTAKLSLEETRSLNREALNNATNLTEAERTSFKADLSALKTADEMNELMAEVNATLPIVLDRTKWETIEKKSISDTGVEGEWKKIDDLFKVYNVSQKTIFEFGLGRALNGVFYINASYVADYKHVYDIINSKYTYDRANKSIVVNAAGLLFTYALENYDHKNQEIQLRITNYNNGTDHKPGVPYSTDGVNVRYMIENYILKMKISSLETQTTGTALKANNKIESMPTKWGI